MNLYRKIIGILVFLFFALDIAPALSNDTQNKPVVIMFMNLKNYGYTALAQRVYKVVNDNFPEKKITIISKGLTERDFDYFDSERVSIVDLGKHLEGIHSYTDEIREEIDQILHSASAIITINGTDQFIRTVFDQQAFCNLQFINIVQIFGSTKLVQDSHGRSYTKNRADGSEYTNNCRHIRMGLGDHEGILVNPDLLKDSYRSALSDHYQSLKERLPGLAQFIEESANNYYVSYMHSGEGLVDFVATASRLEGEKGAWVITNQGKNDVFSYFAKSIFTQHGISKIEFKEFRVGLDPLTTEEVINNLNGQTVKIFHIPKIDSQHEYYSLIENSNPMVGVTGNSSLFDAITLGKVPFYKANHRHQDQINSQLAALDQSGLLKPFFKNYVDPETKANTIRDYSYQIPAWTKSILEERTFNSQLAEEIKFRINSHQAPKAW
ncbi:hypothetical protein [Endozoicomonas lisbonensis]|uniref:Uncharacterized protein n=1 Tax=Endozoicomonas lisbonensis TaxID=3120522 RepID=A0ABV2SAU5_9GAMM